MGDDIQRAGNVRHFTGGVGHRDAHRLGAVSQCTEIDFRYRHAPAAVRCHSGEVVFTANRDRQLRTDSVLAGAGNHLRGGDIRKAQGAITKQRGDRHRRQGLDRHAGALHHIGDIARRIRRAGRDLQRIVAILQVLQRHRRDRQLPLAVGTDGGGVGEQTDLHGDLGTRRQVAAGAGEDRVGEQIVKIQRPVAKQCVDTDRRHRLHNRVHQLAAGRGVTHRIGYRCRHAQGAIGD